MLGRRDFRLSSGYYYTVLSILIPVVFSMNFPWDKYQETSRPVSEAEECTLMSQDLIHTISQRVDPCDDFYEYVCGDWKRHSDLEAYTGFLDLESVLQYDGYRKLKSILEVPTNPRESPEVKQAKLLYRYCMSLPYMERTSESVLRDLMKKYGYWSTASKKANTVHPWLTIHNYYLSISGSSAFFRIDFHVPEDGKKPFLRLQRAASPYGTMHHTYNWDEEQRLHYFKFLEDVITGVTSSEHSTFPIEYMKDDLRDVFKFRLALQKVIDACRNEVEYSMSVSKIDPSNATPMKIKDFKKLYIGKNCPENSIGNVNWLELFRAITVNNKEITVTEDTVIYVHSMDYIQGLCSLLSHTRQRTIVNHIHLYFMERYLSFTSHSKQLLTFITTRGLVSTGKVRYIPPQWYSCIQYSNMKSTLGELYSKSYINPATLQGAHNMIEIIREIIKMQVDNVKWLKDSGKRSTIQKLKDLKFVVGYPNENELKMDEEVVSLMQETSIRPYAFYKKSQNMIYVSSFYFQQPMYDQNLPFVVTYAALGSLIAHEIYHMFDDESVSGTLQSLWGRKSTKHYKENAACFVDYYERQPIKDLERRVFEKPKLNSYLTRDENVADVMGLKAAFNAYKRMVWVRKGICPTLPRFENMSCDRLFFIAYARTYCSVVPKEMFVRRLRKAQHSPYRLRVNVPVSNMKEFAQAFKCAADKPMNPVNKCDIWM